WWPSPVAIRVTCCLPAAAPEWPRLLNLQSSISNHQSGAPAPPQQVAEDRVGRLVERFEPAHVQLLLDDQPTELLEEPLRVARLHHQARGVHPRRRLRLDL